MTEENKMRIAIATMEFVTEKFFSGGLGNYTANWASILADHGHEVHIFVPSHETDTLDWKTNVCVHRVFYREELQRKSKMKSLCRYRQALWNLFGASYTINKALKKESRKGKFDVVQYCDAGALAILSPIGMNKVIRLSSYPLLWRLADEEDFDMEEALRTKMTQPEIVRMLALFRTKKIIAPSNIIATYVGQKVGRNIQVIESPVNVNTTLLNERVYKELLEGKKYFLFFGTLNRLKGIGTIGEILPAFLQKYPDRYFVFVGASSKLIMAGETVDAKEYLLEKAGEYRNRVMFIDALSEKGCLYSIIRHAQACVLPSRIDNLPNTCIETMALGQVVIGSNGASFEQLIENGYNGWLIERDNSEDLLSKIDLAISMTEKERKEFGERSKKRLSKMDPERVYENMLRVYLR